MAGREKFEFTGHDGSRLAALLERPDGPYHATALFAHCFTCGKDIVAASRISRALVRRGYAVMRFDFTGLGSSDGDFANTNFSSNVQDLVAATVALRERGLAPALLVGHSLGGTAVLAAANQVAECRAVATIGAPADARHVAAQFGSDIARIEADGQAEVSLAGRPFTIKRQFLEDIEKTSTAHLAGLRAALLVLHAPLDATVSIDEAGRIFTAAKHPKSFIGLDGADHLLSRSVDAERVAEMIAVWAGRYVESDAVAAETAPRPTIAAGEVRVRENDGKFLQNVFSDTHHWLSDEPTGVGGTDLGPDPYEHLLAAVGTCTAMTLRMYASRKNMALEKATVTLRHSREHRRDCDGCEDTPKKLDVIERDIELLGTLNDDERRRLMSIADRCPVHRTLEGELDIRTRER